MRCAKSIWWAFHNRCFVCIDAAAEAVHAIVVVVKELHDFPKPDFHPNATHATQAIAFGWKLGLSVGRAVSTAGVSVR